MKHPWWRKMMTATAAGGVMAGSGGSGDAAGSMAASPAGVTGVAWQRRSGSGEMA